MGYLEEMIEDAKKKKAVSEEKAEKPRKKEEKPKKMEAVEKPLEAPQEIPAEAEPEIPGKKTLITSYGDVKIYKVEGEALPVYSVPVIKPTGPEKVIVNTIREAATRLITTSPEEIRDPERRRNFYFKRVREIIESSPELHISATKMDFYADMVVREMIGYGVLDSMVKDSQLEEIMVNGPNKPVYVVHREYGMLKTNIEFGNDEDIRNIISRIARDVNRRIDIQDPLLDARLPDGSRVNATIKPVSLDGSTITIRKFRKDPFTAIDLIKYGTINADLAAFLWTAVDGLGAKPANVIVSGGTGSGKTTTLNVLSSFIPERERVITIEDTAELILPIKHWIRFETRPPGLEGKGEITMDVLVKNALRMRPDRIIVGEVRHAEAFTLMTAINTGHDGSMGTIHANSAHETIIRLMSPPMSVPPVMIEALDFILVEQRIYDRKKGTIRRVTELAEVVGMEGEKAVLQTLFTWDPATDTFTRTKFPCQYLQKLQSFTGLTKEEIEKQIEKRKIAMEEMLRSNVRSMPDVMEGVRKFEAGS